jgi:hypothetical protein
MTINTYKILTVALATTQKLRRRWRARDSSGRLTNADHGEGCRLVPATSAGTPESSAAIRAGRVSTKVWTKLPGDYRSLSAGTWDPHFKRIERISNAAIF